MIKGGKGPIAHGRFAVLPGQVRDLDAGRPENATKVLRLGSLLRRAVTLR
jgi:hypothetical protein